jgi:hypothetical protein
MAFALNYVADDAPLSIESLENKGMKRKAAAAAHDAAANKQSTGFTLSEKHRREFERIVGRLEKG